MAGERLSLRLEALQLAKSAPFLLVVAQLLRNCFTGSCRKSLYKMLDSMPNPKLEHGRNRCDLISFVFPFV